ncbi:hypothetical protein L6R49_17115 [Myxococcota bacterium]|nr:hypothetical protein [Myxococcota bacterium]
MSKPDAPGADLPEACLSCSGCGNPSPQGIAPKSDLKLARLVETQAGQTTRLEQIIAEEIGRALGR